MSELEALRWVEDVERNERNSKRPIFIELQRIGGVWHAFMQEQEGPKPVTIHEAGHVRLTDALVELRRLYEGRGV